MNKRIKKRPAIEWKLKGPEFIIVLESESFQVERRAKIRRYYNDDWCSFEAVDAPSLQPRIFISQNVVDWDFFKTWLIDAWEHQLETPIDFQLQKHLDPELITSLAQTPGKDWPQVITALRDSGFLKKAPPLPQVDVMNVLEVKGHSESRNKT